MMPTFSSGSASDVLDDHGLQSASGAGGERRLLVAELRAERLGREAALVAHDPAPGLAQLDAGGPGAQGLAPHVQGTPDDRIDAQRRVHQLVDGFQ